MGLHEIPEKSQLIGSNRLRRLLTAKNNICYQYLNSCFSSDHQRSKYLPNLIQHQVKQGAKVQDERAKQSLEGDKDKPIIHQCEEMKEYFEFLKQNERQCLNPITAAQSNAIHEQNLIQKYCPQYEDVNVKEAKNFKESHHNFNYASCLSSTQEEMNESINMETLEEIPIEGSPKHTDYTVKFRVGNFPQSAKSPSGRTLLE
ncbi:hypothetical protein FGO68_gene353 [Halteria grandinella]|uniref:Uncharacterized protein n=1 Tax=Halteria grandinella TaxID=5974 RepID=A0A8J8NQJ4_HALGN|nr:hypothetical protein FGO68_gene353 [Halteria grandinella]